jgi:hypothetical protein
MHLCQIEVASTESDAIEPLLCTAFLLYAGVSTVFSVGCNAAFAPQAAVLSATRANWIVCLALPHARARNSFDNQFGPAAEIGGAFFMLSHPHRAVLVTAMLSRLGRLLPPHGGLMKREPRAATLGALEKRKGLGTTIFLRCSVCHSLAQRTKSMACRI